LYVGGHGGSGHGNLHGIEHAGRSACINKTDCNIKMTMIFNRFIVVINNNVYLNGKKIARFCSFDVFNGVYSSTI